MVLILAVIFKLTIIISWQNSNSDILFPFVSKPCTLGLDYIYDKVMLDTIVFFFYYFEFHKSRWSGSFCG